MSSASRGKWHAHILKASPRGWIVLGLFIVVLSSSALWFAARHHERTSRQDIETTLLSIIDLKVSQIEGWMRERRGDAAMVRSSEAIQKMLSAPRDKSAQVRAREYFRELQTAYGYDLIAAFDSRGAMILATSTNALGQHSCISRHVNEALRSRDIVVTDLHRGQTNEPIHFSLLCPIRLGVSNSPTADGVVLLVVDPYRFLYPFVQSWPVPSESGETLLIQREGSEVVYLNETRHRRGIALNLRVPASRLDMPTVQAAVTQGRGVLAGIDYRGVPVMEVARPVDGTTWLMIAKMDQAEIEAPLKRELWKTGSVVGLAVAAALLGLGMLWRQQRLEFVQRELVERKVVESALRASEARFRGLFENAYDGLMVLEGPSWCVVSANPACLRMFGAPDLLSLLSSRPWTLSPERQPDGRLSEEKGREMMAEAYGKGFYHFEWTHRRMGGEEFFAEILLVRVDQEGRPVIQATIRDVTSRKQIELARRNEQVLNEAMIAAFPGAFYLLSKQGRYVRWNAYHRDEIVGLSDEQLAKANVLEMVHPDDRAQLQSRITQVLDQGIEGTVEARVLLHGGPAFRWLLMTGRRLLRENQPYLVGFGIDITARKLAEAALQAREEVFSTIVGQAMVAIALVDGRTTGFVEFNTEAHTGLGYTREEFARLTITDIQAEHSPEQIRENIRLIQQEGGIAFESQHRHRNGELRDVRVSARPLRLQDQDYMAAVWEDITERKRSEAELRRHMAFEHLFSRISSDFVGVAASQTDQAIQQALALIGTFAGVDRAYVFILQEEGATTRNTHEWCAPGVTPQKSSLQNLPTAAFPWWMNQLRSRNTIHIANVAELPMEAAPEKALLEAQQIKSLVAIPMVQGDELTGFLGLDAVSQARIWTDNEQSLLRLLGATFSNAIQRQKAESELRNEQQRLASIITGADVGTWEWNVQTGETKFNERWAEIVGYTLAELSPTSIETWARLAHPEDLKISNDLLQKHFKGEISYYDCECRMKHKDGRWVWVLDRGKVTTWSQDGNPLWMQGVHTEVTERKQRDAYRQMGNEILFILSQPGELGDLIQRVLSVIRSRTEIEAAALRLEEGADFPYFAHEGYAPNFLRQENFLLLPGSPESTGESRRNRWKCLCGVVISGKTDPAQPLYTRGGSAFLNETSNSTLSAPNQAGERHHPCPACHQEGFASIALIPVRARERIIGLIQLNDRRRGRFSRDSVELLEDIGRSLGEALLRKQAEQALFESQERLRHLIAAAQDAIIMMDPTGKISLWNESASRMLGYTEAEALGSNLHHLLAPPRYAREHEKAFGLFRQTGTGAAVGPAVELSARRKDGSEFPIELSLSPVRLAGGWHAVGIIRDISERKKLQAEREAIEAQLRQQQKLESLGTLAGGVAHEINNPVNGIMNYAQLIQDGLPPDHSLAEYTHEILHETRRVAAIVRNLLTFARDERQAHSPARIEDIIESTLSLIRTVIRHDQITFQIEVPPDLPPLKCRSQQIQQVLMNLVTNARDALNERYAGHDPNKLMILRVSQLERASRRWLRLMVEDHGTGITPEVQARMFDPFFTTKGRNRGTGLGLSISHSIVKEHHGEICVETHPGEFTRMQVDLPVDNGWEIENPAAT